MEVEGHALGRWTAVADIFEVVGSCLRRFCFLVCFECCETPYFAMMLLYQQEDFGKNDVQTSGEV